MKHLLFGMMISGLLSAQAFAGRESGGGSQIEGAFRLRAFEIVNNIAGSPWANSLCPANLMKSSLMATKIRIVDQLIDPSSRQVLTDLNLDAWTVPGDMQLLKTSWAKFLDPANTQIAKSVDILILHEVYRSTAGRCDDEGFRISENIFAFFDHPTDHSPVLPPLGSSETHSSVLQISDPDGYNFGTNAVGGVVNHTIQVKYRGLGQVRVSAKLQEGVFRFKDGSYPGTGGTCGATLASGGSCSVVVSFAPNGTTPSQASLTFKVSNGKRNHHLTIELLGAGAAPASLSLSGAFDYGTQVNGAEADTTFVVVNSGGITASIMSGGDLAAPFRFKGGTYPGTGGTCGAGLASSADCTIVVTYSPTQLGSQTGALNIRYFDGINQQAYVATLVGKSVAPALLTLSDGPTYDFKSVRRGLFVDHTFTLTNAGGAEASTQNASGLSSPFQFKGGSYPGTGGTCSSTLASSNTCTVVVTFAPTSPGAYSASLSIGYNDGVNAQSTVRAMEGSGN